MEVDVLIMLGMAGCNALIVLVVTVWAFNAPIVPVVLGCLWALIGTYLLARMISGRIALRRSHPSQPNGSHNPP